jgi:PHB/PHA accumulation regulator DNA-binding domain
MSGRGDQAGHPAGIEKMDEAQSNIFADLAEGQHQEGLSRDGAMDDWSAEGLGHDCEHPMEADMVSELRAQPILIRRYGRSRLYDMVQLRYLTLEDLRQWTADRIAFVVVDVETGADVTRVLLA